MRHLPVFNRYYLQSVYLLAVTALRDRYQHTFMGSVWAVLQPSVYILMLSFVFAAVLQVDIANYPVFLASGMLPWNFLVNSLTIGCGSLVSRESVLKRAVIPKTMFIVADVMSQFYIYIISLVSVFAVLALVLPGSLHWTMLLMPYAALPLIITTLCGAMLLAYIGAYVRDVEPLLTIVFQIMFWTAPIVYSVGRVPEAMRPYMEYNPLYLLIHPLQQIFHAGEIPGLQSMGLAFATAGVVALLALLICAKLRRNVIFYL